MGLAETAELAVRISLKGDAARGLRGLQGQVKGLSTSLGRVGRGFGQIGTGLARAGLVVGGAAVTGLAAVAKAAIDFEDAFAGVRKTVNESDLAAAGLTFEGLAQQFRDMATEIPIAATELARIGETAGALGVAAGDIDDFTKTVALLSQTTNLTSDAAAEALGKVGTILGLTGDEYTDFADTLVNLGNQGASTESEIIEITKRFAAMGDQAGLSTDQILALSSAAASLGIEPEAAGGALSRIFSNMSTEIANGTKKGKEFAEVTGDSLDTLRKRIDKGDALGILMDTLEGLQGLSRTEGASVLKALGITNQRDRNAILLMANNLEFVNEQLQIAKESEGALWKEAEKRFAATASKIQLVKNNLIETGIAIGTEMMPAINRVLGRALDFLRDPSTKAEAKKLGRDVGAFIDSIDWDKVKEGALAFKGVMKGALDFVLLLVSAIDKLPGEIKAAGLGFLALNKLSGGLIGAGAGNVAGGLAETAIRGLGSRAPGVGRLFAQPVFVTNWPMGGMGGGAGGVAGAVSRQSLISMALGTLPVLMAAAVPIAIGVGLGELTNEAARNDPGLQNAVKVRADAAAAGRVLPGARGGPQSVVPVRVINPREGGDKTGGQLRDLLMEERESQRKLLFLDDRLQAVRSMSAQNKAAVERNRIATVAATRTGDAAIVAAIRANRSIVNVRVGVSVYGSTYQTARTITRAQSGTGASGGGALRGM